METDMVELDQYKYTLGGYKQPLKELEESLDLVNKKNRISQIEKTMEAVDFWDDSNKSKATIAEMKKLKSAVAGFENLSSMYYSPWLRES